MHTWSGTASSDYDIVVVGSGAAGLTAALTAASAGARVAIFEKSQYLGGTSAVSGGMIWIPLNRRQREAGLSDSREAALNYLDAVSKGRTRRSILEALVDRGDEMLGFLEARSPLRFVALNNFPDYHAEWQGASSGRSLEPCLYGGDLLGDLQGAVRPDQRPPFTMQEYEDWRIFPRFHWAELHIRAKTGAMARGRALVAPLLRACADAGVTLVTESPITRLAAADSRVTGIMQAEGPIGARKGVVLACGGFEWDPELVQQFLPGPIQASCSPPHNRGDGIRMAAKLGAQLRNMNEAWWGPMVVIPGDTTDDAPTGTLLRFERTGPGSIMVNRKGRRFVNEAHNYNDMTKTLHAFDPGAYTYANLPAYLIFDQGHLERYGFLSARADQPVPDWLRHGQTLRELASGLGIDAQALGETVERFNAHARQGVDPDYNRGAAAYDRYWGDLEAPHPALGPLEKPPFYGLEVVSGAIGTKGGVATDACGRALDVFEEVIPGLYAAGNTSAHPMGAGYPGAGGTLGPAMTMAYLAALDATAA